MVVRNFKDNPIQTWEITEEYWYVVTDSLVGGYALANTRAQYTDELDYNAGEFEVCNALFKEIGEHIAHEHNSRLQDDMFKTYHDNVIVAVAQDISRFYGGKMAPLPVGVVPLTADEDLD